LNRLLGTEAGVRVLRVLAQTQRPMGAGELARRTALTYTAVSRTLNGLIDAGILDPVASDRGLRVQYRKRHPLAAALSALYDSESARRERVLKGVRAAADALSPPPKSVWLEGPAATDTDEFGDPLTVGVLTGSKVLGATRETLRDALADLEREEDVSIEIRACTDADLSVASAIEVAALREALPILGPGPAAYLEAEIDQHRLPVPRSHADLDDRSRAFAIAIADRILKDPSIVERAKEYVSGRLDTASSGERKELVEWAHVLDTASVGRLRRLLMSESERATRLRQTMPFLAILSEGERAALARGKE
jgi:DNA-binding transcriptional ArsR family regulator